jgi:hypothetical protein
MKVKKPTTKLPKRRNIEPWNRYDPRDKYDPELDKISHVSWFPEKVARAGEALKNVKLPKL